MQALPLSAVLGLAAFMVERDGAYAGTVWYPVALIALGILVTLALSVRGVFGGLSRASVGATGCFAGFTAWSFASIAWAAVQGDAWDGANRTLFYGLVFVLLADWRASGRALWPPLMVISCIVAVEGVVTVEQIIHTNDPSQFAIGTRLSEPLGYPNATAALFMIMAWLMIGLASRPWLPAPARGLAFGLAGLHATLNLLTESRGSAYTLPLVVVAYFVLVPGRLRSLAALVLVIAGFASVVRPALRVYGASSESLSHTLSRAIDLGLLWAVILTGAGWLFAAVDARISFSAVALRRIGVGVLAAAAVTAVVLLAALRPWQRVDSEWRSFKYGAEPGGNSSHFGGLGSNRYDFWRVGLVEFKRHPVQGIGVDNFLVPYLQQRRSIEEPMYPHSLAIRLLSQTGIIGTALFAGFLAFTLLVVERIPAGRERDLARILVVGASAWILHGLVDWLWEMPVLGVLGMGLLGAACGLAPRREPRETRGWLPSRRLLLAGGLGVALVAAASLAVPWIAQREVQQAAATWRADPAGAFSTLSRARTLNPLSDQADLVAGAIASHLHRYEEMEQRFGNAVKRSPDDWYANLELGIAASLTGHHELAAASLGRAAALDPGDLVVRRVRETFAAGRRIDSDAVDREFAEAG